MAHYKEQIGNGEQQTGFIPAPDPGFEAPGPGEEPSPTQRTRTDPADPTNTPSATDNSDTGGDGPTPPQGNILLKNYLGIGIAIAGAIAAVSGVVSPILGVGVSGAGIAAAALL